MNVVNIKPTGSWLVPGDIHFGRHDRLSLELMTTVAEEHGVDNAILIGDSFDSYGISRHPKSAARLLRASGVTIEQEAKSAKPWFERWQYMFDQKLCITGNHEAWWELVQDEYPGLVGTEWWDLYGDLFDGWHCYKHGTALKLGPLLVAHGDELRGSLASSSAASVLRNYPGQNTLYGHTHRIDTCTRPTSKYGKPVNHGAWTIGCLMDLAAAADDRNLRQHAQVHQQGFAIVTFDVSGEAFQVEQVAIHNGPKDSRWAFFRGEKYIVERKVVAGGKA